MKGVLMNGKFVIGYDVGTGGSKAVLVTTEGQIVAQDFEPYEVDFPAQHCAEQNPLDWWNAVCANAKRLVTKAVIEPDQVAGIAFSSQMLGVLPMAESGEALCPAIIWMDCRAQEQADRLVRRMGGKKLLINLVGAVPSGKDVICKIKWLKESEPSLYEKTHKFLDVKGYLVYRATGVMEMDQTAASVTGFMNKKTRDWDPVFGKLLGIDLEKMPEVKRCTAIAGGLTEEGAAAMGLPVGTPVISGMGDAPAAAIGAGILGHGDSAVSIGTSGLLLITLDKPVNLGKFGMASTAAADPRKWLLIGETNTAGGALKWFADQLADKERQALGEDGLYQALDQAVASSPPGARSLIFTPWMYGERAPVTDTTLRGAFLNVSIDHTREDMLRAVYEGVALNFRWMLEAAVGAGLPCPTVRAIGGGALSDAWMQIFADVTRRRIEAMERAPEAGALGAALAVPLALGMYKDYSELKGVVRVRRTFEPDTTDWSTYEQLFRSFRTFYDRLAPVYRQLNA